MTTARQDTCSVRAPQNMRAFLRYGLLGAIVAASLGCLDVVTDHFRHDNAIYQVFHREALREGLFVALLGVFGMAGGMCIGVILHAASVRWPTFLGIEHILCNDTTVIGRLQRRGVISVMIAFFFCANIFGPELLWRRYDATLITVPFTVGWLVSEVCLLAIWLALGGQAVKFRLPLTLTLLVVVPCSFLVGIQRTHSLCLEDATVFACLGLMMFCCMQVPLWGVRAITQRRIDLPQAATLRTNLAQFGLMYLLTCTAAVGVLMVFVKKSLPVESLGGTVPWYNVIHDGCVMTAFSVLACLPCIWLALTDTRQILWTLWLAIVWIAGPEIVFPALVVLFSGANKTDEAIGGIFCYGLGVAGTTLLVLLVVRSLGYRLIRPAPTDAPPP